MAELVTLRQALAHLRLPVPADVGSPPAPLSLHDQDLQAKIDQATELVLGYLTKYDTTWAATVASWGLGGSPEVAPPNVVVAAILRQTAELYRFRGDDPQGDTAPYEEGGELSPGVTALLKRLRDPAMA